MISAIAWDIDGTLVDSEPLHLFVLQEACARFKVDISDLADDHFIGVHISNVWRELAPRFPADLTFAEWSGALDSIYAANTSRLKEIEGASWVVRDLATQGIRQVAVSNSNRRVVDANLAALALTDVLEFSLSLDDVLEGKPDPFPYQLACSRLRLMPSCVLAVEDSATGAASARAAGLPLAFLGAWEDQHTDHIISLTALTELPKVIKRDSIFGSVATF